MNTILIIEDNTDICENICELLELDGNAVICANSGEAGLLMAREKHPDLILCDILMAGMNGYQVFDALSSDMNTATIPFVFITANTEKKDVEKGMRMGAKGYIRKPFEESDLLDAIADCLKVAPIIRIAPSELVSPNIII